ncbi:hypothetical protein HID58_043205 [Brassica napus]|uniref:Uncharacterized protein n=2 Tax=Brassica napus TaxID=3708 RepID=A0ABQ8BFU7_BRANA|nr:hypothetical protein HID58_043205 [Brassica napus]CDY48828.1 BnaC01g43360D [Brassica napus]
MAKSKSKKKGNLNSQPSSPQIDRRDDEQIRELRCEEDDATTSRSELRCGEDDRTASRFELWCGDDAATSRSDLRCEKEDDKLLWCEDRFLGQT